MNGAQITAVLEVKDSLNSGAIDPVAAKELIISVGLSPDAADRIVGKRMPPRVAGNGQVA